ncbi:MAG: ornithine--oxo-acid transaminase [Xanthomonadaceae bacterium]|nr:ornithine--oxo-acid transaminase [Xanthomonadaceae bacterium]
MKQPLSSQESMDLEAKYGAHNYHPLPVVLSRGEGIYLWNPEGKKFMDFLAGYSAVNQGHCHPKIIAALTEQAKQLTLTSRAFYNDKLGLAEKYVCEFFGYQKALFMNSGVEANETALKITRKWAYDVKKIPVNQAKIIAVQSNFHGRTLGVISASTDSSSKTGFGPYMPGYIVVPYDDLEALNLALEDPTVAGFWVEPIQGEAGVVVPSKGYLKKASELCRKNNVLLLADEIQTGIGRTGKLLACEYENVKPDILILGKSLSGGTMPISVVLTQDSVMDVIKPGSHGSTFGGNPLAAHVVIAALNTVHDEKLVENSHLRGEQFRKELAHLKKLPFVKDIRGLGLMNAIEIENSPKRSAWDICMKLMEAGLLAKPTHETTIRLTPPLVISEKQMSEACSIISAVFSS